MKKCLVIGASMLDIVMRIDILPKSGEDVYIDSQETLVGGCAFNVADMLKNFNIPATLFSPIGTGIYSDIITQKLKKSKQKSPIRSDSCDNGYCLCIVEKNGERTFLTLPGIECRFEKQWFDVLEPGEYDCAYVSGYEIEGEGGEAILSFLEEHEDLTVYYAPGPRITYISQEKHERLFSTHPIVHLNDKEILDYTGESTFEMAAQKIYEATKSTVIITLGERGACYYDGQAMYNVPSKKVEVIDTNGAGDSHIGTIISMRKLGKSFQDSIAKANSVSALIVGISGSTLT